MTIATFLGLESSGSGTRTAARPSSYGGSGGDPDTTYEDFRQFCETRSAEVVANIAVYLVHQANYLLDQQIRQLEKDYLQNGGVRERMSRVCRQRRK